MNIRQTRDIWTEIAQKHPEVRSSPDPRVRFRSFGDFALNLELLRWIDQPADRGRLVHELSCEIYETFAEAGINIQFPQRDVWLKELAA